MGNVILVGMPSCGKTTIGIALARVMDRRFVDLDDRIMKWEGMKLQEIIDANGIDYFHDIESFNFRLSKIAKDEFHGKANLSFIAIKHIDFFPDYI